MSRTAGKPINEFSEYAGANVPDAPVVRPGDRCIWRHKVLRWNGTRSVFVEIDERVRFVRAARHSAVVRLPDGREMHARWSQVFAEPKP